MAISHKDHNHPNTPAARAKCRKELGQAIQIADTTGNKLAQEILNPARMTVVPRRRGDRGVVQGLKDAKRPNTLIKDISDLADVPHILAYGIRMAWALDLDVRVGTPFNDAEKRVVVQADKAEIAFVWRVANPNGMHAVFVRNWDSSKTFKVASVQQAFEVSAHDAECWDEYGNLVL